VMNKVIKLTSRTERGPHLSGEAFCARCHHEWISVAPVGTVDIECPECHTMKGLFKHGCEPQYEAWTCNCGCYMFMISPKGIICWNCGDYQSGM